MSVVAGDTGRPLGARLLHQPMTRVRLRGRLLHPYWHLRFASFGENSILHRPVWLRGAHKIAVGRDCVLLIPQLTVSPRAWARPEPALQIGDRVLMRPFSSIAASESVIIEDDVTIASLSLVLDCDRQLPGPVTNVPTNPATKPHPVRIGRGTAIGERVAVLPGSEIGEGCQIRANSVVQGRIPDHSVVAGFPARVIGDSRQGGPAYGGGRRGQLAAR